MKKKWLILILGISILAFNGTAHANTEPVIEPGGGGGEVGYCDLSGSDGDYAWFCHWWGRP